MYLLLFALGIAAIVVLIVINRKDKAGEPAKKEEIVLTPQQKTANSIVNVMDIDENFLYTKDGYLIGFLRLGNINIEL